MQEEFIPAFFVGEAIDDGDCRLELHSFQGNILEQPNAPFSEAKWLETPASNVNGPCISEIEFTVRDAFGGQTIITQN